MNQEEFDRYFRELTPTEQRVLEMFASGKTDLDISACLENKETTVRKHIEKICETLGIEKQKQGKRRTKRAELIALLAKYKPELLGNSTPAIAPEVKPATVTSQETTPSTAEPDNGLDAALSNPNFVGRKEAIAHLNTLVSQGAKVIFIQAPGGVGKTTLAQQYIKTQGFDLVLDLPMAKEKENITAVESEIEEWFKQDFEEEPGREFGVMLRRLKRQLQTRKVGVLIDNLEPALDKQGRFIEKHRRYVELLRVLADPTVQSVTLITSREPLAECVDVANYSLPSLNEQAWLEFFSSRHINVDAKALEEMHKAYGGNALAMKVLCDPIQKHGGMTAYWREHKVKAGLVVELAVENLIKDQFNRLEEIYPEAYRLLCRLGCFRYQDVPTVPTEGLLCLLWDVPEIQHKRIIESLRNRSLVEFCNGEYWLHPVIRAEALKHLRTTEDWKIANCKAAEYWTSFVELLYIRNNQECLKKLEAFYHYIELKFWENAAEVLVADRSGLALLGRLRCFGYIEKSISLINVLLNTNSLSNSSRGELYAHLGDFYSIFGQIKEAMTAYEQSINFKNYINPIFYVDVLGALAYLYIALGEYNKSINSFEDIISPAEDLKEQGNQFLVYINACLSFSYYQIEKHEQSLMYLNNAIKFQMYLEESDRTWITAYGLYTLGKAMVANNYLNKAEEIYKKLKFCKNKLFYLFQGLAANGEAELYREQGDFETALTNHSESIEILDKIGAKCDLAEAYYQLGLTYQKMGDIEKSQAKFDEAIRLFNEIEAPKQVEKVRRAMQIGG